MRSDKPSKSTRESLINGNQAKKANILERTVTRRQAIKVGGIAAVGLAFSKPLVDTIYPKPAFANYRVSPPAGDKFCNWHGQTSDVWRKRADKWCRWNGRRWKHGRWARWENVGWRDRDWDESSWAHGDWWKWVEDGASEDTWKEDSSVGWHRWDNHSGWKRGNWSWF